MLLRGFSNLPPGSCECSSGRQLNSAFATNMECRGRGDRGGGGSGDGGGGDRFGC